MRPALRLAAVALAGVVPGLAEAAAGQVLFAYGRVSVMRHGVELPLARGDAIQEGDTLRTGPAGLVQMRMLDGALIALRSGTDFEIKAYNAPMAVPVASAALATAPAEDKPSTGRVLMALLRGGFRTITGSLGKVQNTSYQVQTPVATIGVRGTTYQAQTCEGDCGGAEDGLHVAVSDGEIVLSNDAGNLDLGNDGYAFVGKDAPPEERLEKPEFMQPETPPAEEGATEEQPPVEGVGTESSEAPANEPVNTDAPATEPFQPPQQEDQLIPTFRALALGTAPALLGPNLTGVELPATDDVAPSFDGNGGLVAFTVDVGSGPQRIELGTASVQNTGHDPATGIRWGRWAGGTVDVDGVAGPSLGSQSLHYVVSPEIAGSPGALALTGTATYSLVGNTDPTDASGNAGFLGSATFGANFTLGTVTSTIDLSINSDIWNATGSGTISLSDPTFSGSYSVLKNTVSGGTGEFAGFFVPGGEGALPSGAGLTYVLEHSGESITGTAVFGNPAP